VKTSVTGANKNKYSITYPDKIYMVESVNMFDRFIRDTLDYVNGIVKVDSGEEYWVYQVNKYSFCGKQIGELKVPVTRFEPKVVERQEYGIVERPRKVIEEYGDPLVAPNGDVYTWKRTPATYSILKWTWQDDPNVPTGPDGPTNFQVQSAINGLYLTWELSLQDPGCVTGYEIERATSSGGVYSTVGTVEKGVIKHTDTTAEAGTTYYYKMRAKADSEYSEYVGPVSGKR